MDTPSGIGWVSELVEIAGGEDVFSHMGRPSLAKDRIVPPEAVIAALKASELGQYISENYNTQSLKAFVREVAEEARLRCEQAERLFTEDEVRAALPAPLGAEARFVVEGGSIRIGIPLPRSVALQGQHLFPPGDSYSAG